MHLVRKFFHKLKEKLAVPEEIQEEKLTSEDKKLINTVAKAGDVYKKFCSEKELPHITDTGIKTAINMADAYGYIDRCQELKKILQIREKEKDSPRKENPPSS